MELIKSMDDVRGLPLSLKPLSLLFFGILIGGLLIGCGLLFRTYSVGMSTAPWEIARQLGLPFVAAEVSVIIYALRRGMNLREIWNSLRPLVQCALGGFFGLYWVGAAFFSELAALAHIQNIIVLIHLIFGAAVYHSVSSVDAKGLRDTAGALAIGLAIFSGMTALAFINHPPFESMPNGKIVWQFIIPGFISVRLFGAFCGAIFCFLLAQLLIDDERDEVSSYQYLWLSLSAAMWIWSGTRAVVLGIIVTAAIFCAIYKFWPRRIKTIVAIFVSLALAASAATMLVPYDDPAFMLIFNGDLVSADVASGGRLSYWSAVWDAYLTVPYWGAGPFASFWMLPTGEQTHVQPHNIFLQFLISWGLFATIVAFVLLTYAFVKAHIVVLHHRIGLPFLAMLDCLLAMSLVDGMLHFAQHFMLVMLCFGIIFSLTKSLASERLR
jgi:exopolysaccharide production protein ExoQ